MKLIWHLNAELITINAAREIILWKMRFSKFRPSYLCHGLSVQILGVYWIFSPRSH